MANIQDRGTPGYSPKTISKMTPEEIASATAQAITAGQSFSEAKLPGETNAQAQKRIAAGYKELTAQPVISAEQAAAGAKVQYVRTQAGGFGEYVVTVPPGYTGEKITKQFTSGIIPTGSKYTTGGSVGTYINTGITKTVKSTTKNSDGSTTVTFTDGTTKIVPAGTSVPPVGSQTSSSTNAPVGTPPAFVYDAATGKWVQPPKPSDPGNWVWDNLNGWVNSNVNPGSTGFATGSERTLARDTFKNTLALYFGAKEISQPWVDAFYKVVSGYYNSGSDIPESINMAVMDVRNNPTLKPFTDRFKGLYALQDRLAGGEAISVPTVAEFFEAESKMGDVLRNVGLGELATQDFLGDVLGRGKSVLEVSNLVNEVFNAIDNAPDTLKKDLQTYFPGVDRTSLAKALLTGKEGWAELDKKVRGISVMSAAKSQGITVDLPTATDLAQLGTDYTGALAGFQTVKELERGKMLGQISGIKFGQEEAIGAAFKKDAAAIAKLEEIRKQEEARYQGSAGRLASRSRAAGLI